MTGLILVTGATGVVGGELVPLLAAAGQRVRALVRNPAKADFDPAVEVVPADLEDPDTLDAAFAGVQKAFVLVNGPDIAALEGDAFYAAQRAGVEHIVKLSSKETFEGHMDGTAPAEAHKQSEERLRRLGVPWTMLRPGFFASNLHVWFLRKTATGAALYMPTGEGKEAPTDPADIAAAAAKVLTSDGHEGRVYELTGPELLTLTEMTQKMSAATGVSVEHVDVSEKEARARFQADGFPDEFVDFLMRHSASVKAGRMTLASGIPDLLGRPAATFDDWLARNKRALQAFLQEMT